jgi:hypothetical protein
MQKLLITATALAAVLIAPNAAKRVMDVTFANITNATIKVTAKDVNDGNKTIAKDEVLKHNEQITVKMLADKDGNGRVSYKAETTESDSSKRKCMSYEGKQLSNRHTFSISAINKC